MLKTPNSQRKFDYKPAIGLGVLSNPCFQYFFFSSSCEYCLCTIKLIILDKFKFYNAIYIFKNYLTTIFLKINFQFSVFYQPFTAYHRNMQIYRFSEKPLHLLPAHKVRNTWNLLALAFCKSTMWFMWCVFHIQSSYPHSGKNKKRKRKERLHTPVNILYELFLARGNFFAKVNDPELLVSLKKDFIFSSSYYIVLYPTVCTFFFRDICRLVSLKKDFIFSSSYHIMLYPTVCTFSFRDLCRFLITIFYH